MINILSFKLPWLTRMPVAILFVLHFQLAYSKSDWLENCSICHCNWNSGRKTADCKDKRLTSLPTNMSKEIQVIDFSNNMIVELYDEFLNAHFSNLQKLYMRNCTINKVSRNTFKELGILTELDLSQNLIRVLHPGTYTGLTMLRNLIMNHNQIEILNDYLFMNLPYLRHLELKFNRIRHIGIHAFKQLPMLTAVDLEGNELTTLRKEAFLQVPKLISLSLAHNQWNCSCNLKEFRDYTIKNRLYTSPTSCHYPIQLRGKLWSEVPSDNFACEPHILRLDRAINENQSNCISLSCRIIGVPYPNITWVFNKRPVNTSDTRIVVLEEYEKMQSDYHDLNVITSQLTIYSVQPHDNGVYTCLAENSGGKKEAKIQIFKNGDHLNNIDENNVNIIVASESDTTSNKLFHICLVLVPFLIILVILVLIVCQSTNRLRSYQKTSLRSTESELDSPKISRKPRSSIVESSDILEMSKILLNGVNPVEKPPRCAGLECDDVNEMKAILLRKKPFGNLDHCDNEIYSVAPSLGLPAHLEENYGRSLPPDLLSFSVRNLKSFPSDEFSYSNISEKSILDIRSRILVSPLQTLMAPRSTSETAILKTQTSLRTLQHQKPNLRQKQQQSPSVPGQKDFNPRRNPTILMKQGYMTLPRKPRTPYWATPERSGSKFVTFHQMQREVIYDNLGLRTTAGGNSPLNPSETQPLDSKMRFNIQDKHLKATPSLTSFASNMGSMEHNQKTICDIKQSPETSQTHNKTTIAPMTNASLSITTGGLKTTSEEIKIPPTPPPKPKKKNYTTTIGSRKGFKSELTVDDCEDGTEV